MRSSTLASSLDFFFLNCTHIAIRGHVQTIFGKINVIMTLRGGGGVVSRSHTLFHEKRVWWTDVGQFVSALSACG